MAVGLRCDMGCNTWPNDPVYAICPNCGHKTSRFSNLKPITVEEAQSFVRHKAFERYYVEHCARRGQTVSGPLKPC